MNFLDELTKLVDKNVGKIIFFDKKNKEFLVYSKQQLLKDEYCSNDIIVEILHDYHKTRYVEFVEFDVEFIEEIQLDFVESHESLYKGKDIGKPIAITKFKKATLELNLYDEYIDLLKKEISLDVCEWLVDNGIIEIETDGKIYQEITYVLNKIKKHKVFDYFDSKVLFSIRGTHHFLTFNLLNGSDFKGISFYFGDKAFETYQSMSIEHNDYLTDHETMFSLINVCTFYFEQDKNPFDVKNQYSIDEDITSILIMPGLTRRNFLPYSFSLYILQALKDSLKELDDLTNDELKMFSNNNYYMLNHIRNRKKDIKMIPYAALIPESSFYDFEKDDIVLIQPNEYLKEKWSMSFRKLNSYELDENLDERQLCCQYALFVVNEETGMIINMRLVSGKGRPIENAINELAFLFNNKPIAKKLVVNTVLDEDILHFAFGLIEDERKIKISFEPGPLKIDGAIDSFHEEMENDFKTPKFDA